VPGNVEALNALGHCYWKNRNVVEAQRCFREALAEVRPAMGRRRKNHSAAMAWG
jgi:Flp pilus assembly protein TadD